MIACWYGLRSVVAIAGACALATALNAAGRGAPWTLLPGSKVVMVNTDVSCAVTATSVVCEKTGGLATTLAVATNTVRILKNPPPLDPARTTLKLRDDSGFVTAAAAGGSIYCHVDFRGALTMSCAVNGGTSAGARGFDISDSSVVLFRNDANKIRHNLEIVRQP